MFYLIDTWSVLMDSLAGQWKFVAGDLLFLMSGHCRAARSAADKHTCRHNWKTKAGHIQKACTRGLTSI